MPGSSKWPHLLMLTHQNPTCPIHLNLLDLITQKIFGKKYVSLSTLSCSLLHSRYLVPLGVKYTPQHPTLEHPQPTFLPQHERPSFIPIQNNRQNHSSTHINLYIFGQHTGTQGILHQMIVGIPSNKSALHFLLNGILNVGLFSNIWTVPPSQRIY